jgi:hypothetical protein
MALLSFVATLFGGDRSGPVDSQPKPSLSVPLSPAIQACSLRIAALLPDLTTEESEELVLRPIEAFAERVYDLGASERHHHREPFGLRDHSLEAAEVALRIALSDAFVDHVAPSPEEQEFRIPRLRYAAFLFGLLHDIGKILGLRVHAGRETWNPFSESLSEFTLRHTRDKPTVTWRAGRGPDAHVWVQSFLFGLFHSRPMVDYLGAPLLAELLEGRSPAAERLRKIVSEADQRSTRDYEAREARAKRTPEPAEGAVLFEPPVDYADLVPKAFQEALRESIFALNTAQGDLWVGSDFVAFRYPSALQKLAGFVRERLGPVSQKARQLQTGEGGARELAHHLAEHEALFQDGGTGGWKVQVAISVGGAFDATAGVLVRKDFLIPGELTRQGLPLFTGGLSLRRPNDHVELAVPGFRPPALPKDNPLREIPAPPRAAAPPSPPPAPPTAKTLPSKPNPEAAPAPELPAQAALRAMLTPDLLLQDLREGILAGWIPTNLWNGRVYVLPDVTYMVTPFTFRHLVERGLYGADPSKATYDYLNALSKLDCVRRYGASRIVTKILLRKGAQPCAVVVFETRGLFRSEEELARVGYWRDTEIVEAEAEPPPHPSQPTETQAHG